MEWQDRITVDPDVLTGKPVVKGTRLSVELIIDLMGQEWSEEQILENYPALEPEDVHACLRYAAEVLKSEKVYPRTPAENN